MINCPKCDFLQPNDQYCARCGVDMFAYQPAEKPFAQRLLRNTWFQFSLLAIILFTGFGVIREHNSRLLAARIAEIENASSQRILDPSLSTSDAASEAETAGQARSFAETDSQKPAALSESVPVPPPSELSASPPASGSPSTAAGSALGANQARTLAETAPRVSNEEQIGSLAPNGLATNLRVSFAEINRSLLNEIISESRSMAFGSVTVATGLNFETKIKAAETNGEFRVLESSPQQPLRINQPVMIFKGTRDEMSGQNLGLTLQITPSQLDESGTHVQIELLRVLRESGANPPIEEVNIPLPDDFTIPRGASLIISGTMPRKTLTENEDRLYRSVNILRILTTESFRSGSSEFVIHIEPKQ
jgi:hypothetical protein